MEGKSSFSFLLGKFRSRNEIAPAERALFLIVISVAIMFLDFCKFGFMTNVKNQITYLSLPIKCFAKKVSDFNDVLYSYIDLRKENEKLRLEIDKLKAQSIASYDIKKEFEELKKIVGLKYQSDSFDYIEKVLGFDKTIYNSFLLISATQNPTIAGSVVISSEGLVGLIADAYRGIARVITLSSEKMFVPVKNSEGERLILAGNGKNGMISVEIQSNTTKNLNLDDILYTSGEGGTYKENIPVARITKINPDKAEIEATPIVDLSNLSFVWSMLPLIEEH